MTLTSTQATKRSKRARAGALTLGQGTALIFLLVILLVALLAPWIAPHSPTDGNILRAYEAPTLSHPLGLDGSGRDILSRAIHGARTSLLGPAAIVVLSLLLGMPLALLAVWFGGPVKAVVTRLLDVVFAIPGLLLAILAVSIFGPGLWPAILALAVAYLPYSAKLILAAATREREAPYIQALTIQGMGVPSILIRHLVRNLASLLIGQTTIAFAYALADLAALSFLGLSVQAPQADWGVMVNDRDALLQGHPQGVVVTATLIVFTILSLFALGGPLSGESTTVPRRQPRRKATR
ncbi:ABC transporter permease [Streptomyces canus]|uniref:ABC transporter permease n=1 Tax=Streptomyces canus TaxID=58343 RepID=UPI00382EF79E